MRQIGDLSQKMLT